MGCSACCARCLAGLPYASLAATALCFAGVALFCGCGHAGLAGAAGVLRAHFAVAAGTDAGGETADGETADGDALGLGVRLAQHVIYAAACVFFLYGVVLLAQGFYASGAARQTRGSFRATGCGRCLGATLVLLTFLLGVAWLGVFGLSALPVFVLHGARAACAALRAADNGTAGGAGAAGADVCVDARQYGVVPWHAVPGRVCGSALGSVCDSAELELSFRLFLAASAGAAATVVALLVYMMAATYNYALLRLRGRDQCCTRF